MPQKNEGIKYEQTTYNKYYPLGLVPKGFKIAESGPGMDFQLQIKGQVINIELKKPKGSSGVDYGQAALGQNPDGTWFFSETKNTKEQITLREILINSGAINFVNKRWNQISRIEQDKRRGIKKSAEAHEIDRVNQYTQARIDGKEAKYAKFAVKDLQSKPKVKIRDQNIEYLEKNALQNAINSFYKAKGVHYIQIFKKGLFSIGNGDPLGLNVPMFRPIVKCEFRLKGRSGYYGSNHPDVVSGKRVEKVGSYGFTSALKAEGIPQNTTVSYDIVIENKSGVKSTIHRNYKIDLDDENFTKYLIELNQSP